MKHTSKLLWGICEMQGVIAIVSLLLMIALNAVEIFRRYFFGLSWIWIQEVTVLLLVCFTFFGFSKVVYDKNDIAIDLVLSRLPGSGRKALQAALHLIVLAFCIVYTYYTYKLLMTQWTQTTPVAHYPMVLRTTPALVNGITMCLIYIREFGQTLLSTEKKEGEGTTC